jgi:hypothetical protein
MNEQVAGAPGDLSDGPATAAAVVRPAITRTRLVLVDVLIGVTTLLAVIAMLAVWANRLLFNPDQWAQTSTELLANPQIRTGTANYLVDQLYANVNVAGLLKSGLPPQLDALAGPAAGALRNVAVQGTELALSRPRVQTLWTAANRVADQTFIAVVNGKAGPVGTKQGVVSLDLASIVDNVAARLGLPAGISAKLPPTVANLTIFKSNQLKFVQDAGNAVQTLALWLTIFVPILYALAILLARGHRRRTLMSVGFAIVLAGIIGVAGRSLLESQITSSLVNDEALRPAVRATVGIGTELLGTIAGAFILFGAVVVASAWFAGPLGIWVACRRAIAPFLRQQPGATFAIVAGLMLLVFIWDPIPATGTPVGIVVFLALALFGTEMLRRQTREEFPDARRGDARKALDARWQSMRGSSGNRGAHHEATALPAPNGLVDQLEKLSALRASGSITPDEYDAAKGRLLESSSG